MDSYSSQTIIGLKIAAILPIIWQNGENILGNKEGDGWCKYAGDSNTKDRDLLV